MHAIQIGTLVDHRVWGRGKVLALSGQNVQAYFPSLTADNGGPIRLVREVVLMISLVQSDPDLDRVISDTKVKKRKTPKAGEKGAAPVEPTFRSAAGTSRRRLTYDLTKAIAWFEQGYPGRFSDEKLLRDEIKYKRDAHQLFEDRLGGGKGRALLDAGNAAEVATLLTALYQSTNIPSRFEIMAARDGLKVPEAGATLLDALLGFLDAPEAGTFDRLAAAVGALPVPADGSRVLTWPNVTILPFLADPTRFMVTKPEIFKQIARRMDIDALYSTTVKWDTYAKVLDLSRKLQEQLAPLGARDFIDVQSFVWVTRRLG
jgi:hypothetical protein